MTNVILATKRFFRTSPEAEDFGAYFTQPEHDYEVRTGVNESVLAVPLYRYPLINNPD